MENKVNEEEVDIRRVTTSTNDTPRNDTRDSDEDKTG